MTVHLSVNINERTSRILRWAELERGMSPQQVLDVGVWCLDLMMNAKEIYLVDKNGDIEPVYEIIPTDPGSIYDI
jgi:hypothetical protein